MGSMILNGGNLLLDGTEMVSDDGPGDNLDSFDPVLLRLALKAARLGTFDYDVVRNRCRWNPRLREMTALPAGRQESFDSFEALLHPEDRERALAAVGTALDPKGDGLYDCEMRLVRFTGAVIWVSATGQCVFANADTGRTPVRLVGIVRDISARMAALQHKDLLIREMSHRVKNSLQMAMTMLKLQARFVDDPTVRAQLFEATGRIQSVAQVHRHLYRADDVTGIAIGGYLRDLITELATHLTMSGTTIDCSVTGDELVLPTDDVFQIGLAVNELVTNAYKYAFAGRDRGRIAITVQASVGQVEIRVADDGVGLPADLDLIHDGQLGMTIIRSIVQQLGGELVLEVCDGTCFQIRMPRR